jgi:hypothetical protein
MVATTIARRRDQPNQETAVGSVARALFPDRDPSVLRQFGAQLAVVDEARANLCEA